MIDIALLLIIAVVTWCVASEGAWGAAFLLFCVIFSGLLAMNFFEPFANFLEQNVASSAAWSSRWDVIALVGLFVGFVLVLRSAVEYLSPSFIQVHPLVYEGVRWSCGVLTGYVTMAFLLTALHTAPLPREFVGFTPERDNLFGISAPDRQWLGFTQYASEKVFRQGPQGRIFDGPRFQVGDQPNDVWPSFPIRYATRREGSATAASGAATGDEGIQRREPAAGGARDF